MSGRELGIPYFVDLTDRPTRALLRTQYTESINASSFYSSFSRCLSRAEVFPTPGRDLPAFLTSAASRGDYSGEVELAPRLPSSSEYEGSRPLK